MAGERRGWAAARGLVAFAGAGRDAAERDFRDYAGFLASGGVEAGDEIPIAQTGQKTRGARIVSFDGDLPLAASGSSVTLAHQLDVARGDMIVPPSAIPAVADQFAAHLVWLDKAHLLPGRTYTLQLGTQTAPALVTALKHKIDASTGAQTGAGVLETNEIGFCNLATAVPIALGNRATRAFIHGR
jgi:bifunctional enzyme CysN/CysC